MRVGVLASGGGSILDAILAAGIDVGVVLVDRPCGATGIASAAGIATELVQRDSFGPAFDRAAYSERVVDALDRHDVDLVVMAGFMTVLAKPFFAAYDGRVVNTHPALLPSFPGAHAVRDALAAGVKVTGCTVHIATVDVDDGPILAQEAVAVLPGDDEATLHERIKVVERRLVPEVISAIVERGTVNP